MLTRKPADFSISGKPELETVWRQVSMNSTRLERHLWGNQLKRAVANPSSTFYELLPTYGLRGATHQYLGRLWYIGCLIGFLAAPAELLPPPLSRAIVALMLSIMAVCACWGWARAITSWRAKRLWLRSKTSPGSAAQSGTATPKDE